jgi:hypothetical protein
MAIMERAGRHPGWHKANTDDNRPVIALMRRNSHFFLPQHAARFTPANTTDTRFPAHA